LFITNVKGTGSSLALEKKLEDEDEEDEEDPLPVNLPNHE